MLPRRAARLSQECEHVDTKHCCDAVESKAGQHKHPSGTTQELEVAAAEQKALDEKDKLCDDGSSDEGASETREQGSIERGRQEIQASTSGRAAQEVAPEESASLPTDVWSRVISFLLVAPTQYYDPDHGAYAMSRDIANASLACREMHVAAAGAWRKLEEAVPIPELGFVLQDRLLRMPGRLTWNDWSKVFRNPNDCPASLLQQAAITLWLPSTGTEVGLVQRVYNHVGLREPVSGTCTAKLWIAYQADKEVAARVKKHRRLEAHLKRRREQQEANTQRRKEQRVLRAQRLQEAQGLGLQQLLCRCGKTASMACSNKMCVRCCKLPCVRHHK